MALNGECACGAVSYSLPPLDKGRSYELSTCHCETCRKWSGGILLSVTPPCKSPLVRGKENISIYKSSEFGERAFCKRCGSSLYFKVVSKGLYENDVHFCAGTLTDFKGLQLTREVFVDSKPSAYAFEDQTKTNGRGRLIMTRADYDAAMEEGGKKTVP